MTDPLTPFSDFQSRQLERIQRDFTKRFADAATPRHQRDVHNAYHLAVAAIGIDPHAPEAERMIKKASANSSVKLAPAMAANDYRNLIVMWGFLGAVIAAFASPDTPDWLLNIIYFAAWVYGAIKAVIAARNWTKISKAENGTPHHAALMTSVPLHNIAVAGLSLLLRVGAVLAAAAIGCYGLACVYLFIALASVVSYYARREYHQPLRA